MNSDSEIQRRKSWASVRNLPAWVALACLMFGTSSSAFAQERGNLQAAKTPPAAQRTPPIQAQSPSSASCPGEPAYENLPTPKLNAITEDMTTVSGTLSGATNGAVQVCVAGKVVGSSTIVDSAGAFYVPVTKLKAGDKVQAQLFVTEDEDGKSVVHYGRASDPVAVTGGSCAKAGSSSSAAAPTLAIRANSDNTLATYSGTVDKSAKGSVRICVNDIPTSNLVSVQNGKFDGGTSSISVAKGDKITAQLVFSGSPPQYSPVSNVVSIGAVAKSPSPTIVMIAGYEQAGFSSLGQNGDTFVDVFYGGPHTGNLSGWGNVRLSSTPQPTTEGIVSSFTNPTGQITTQSYTNVGQALDFLVGPEYKLGSPQSHWGLIGEFGATTPFSSQSTPLTFVVPPPGTVECSTLISRFSPQNGYNPSLAASTNPGTCLQGGYTDIAFANPDRSSFLLKYGVGLRTTLAMPCKSGTITQPCSDSYALLDITFGQDEAVSGGRAHGVVFKLDGVLPVAIANSSWLYLFGSTYIRIQGNQDFSPLILQSPTTPVTIPSPSVIVLPLKLPNRDYFRLGIGINLSQVFCKLSPSGCPNPNSGSD